MKFNAWVDNEGIPLVTLARKLGVNHITIRTLYHGHDSSGRVIKPSWALMRKIVLHTEGRVSGNDLLELDAKTIKASRREKDILCTQG